MNLATDVLGLDGVSYLIQRYRRNDADDNRIILGKSLHCILPHRTFS